MLTALDQLTLGHDINLVLNSKLCLLGELHYYFYMLITDNIVLYMKYQRQ